MKNIVIFGSSSFLAENFISKFKNNQNLILISSKNPDCLNSRELPFLRLNLINNHEQDTLNSISKKIQSYLSFNQTIFILFSWHGKSNKKRNNIGGDISQENKNILNNFQKISNLCNPTKIIFTSSAGSTYDQNSLIPSKESDKAKLYSQYGFEKLEGEKFLKNNINSKILILRIATVYGFNNKESSQGVINIWLKAAHKKEKLLVFNNLSSNINFISVDQVSDAIMTSINNQLSGVINIGTDESISLEKILNAIKKIYGNLKIEIVSNEMRNFLLNTNKFFKLTGKRYKTNCLKDIKDINFDIKKCNP